MKKIGKIVPRLLALAALIVATGPTPVVRAAAPTGRYNRITGGIVYDTKTKLTWQQTVPTTTYTWGDAIVYCENNTAGLPGSGWRLPTLMELVTLVDFSVAPPGPTIDATFFPNTPASNFWTSAPSATQLGGTWEVDFSSGGANIGDESSPNSVRCVR